jgi:hypothetical protein
MNCHPQRWLENKSIPPFDLGSRAEDTVTDNAVPMAVDGFSKVFKGEINVKKILAALLLMGSGLGMAQTADELLNDGKNTENVTTFGMSCKLRMHPDPVRSQHSAENPSRQRPGIKC